MADVLGTCQTQQKKASFVSTPVTHWVDSLAIQCALIATRLVFDVLLLLVKAECLLTSTVCSKENDAEHSSSGLK